jgi:hypothetical protein
MMEIIQEVTEWEFPNHTYALNKGGKAIGYRKASGQIQIFSKPMMFDKKNRKFKKVVDKELEGAIINT